MNQANKEGRRGWKKSNNLFFLSSEVFLKRSGRRRVVICFSDVGSVGEVGGVVAERRKLWRVRRGNT